MRAVLKSFYQNSEIGFYMIKPFARVYQFFLHKKHLSSKVYIEQRFKECFGYPLNLQNPKTLNEKINWLKLNYHHPKATQFADKYAVREYIENTIGKEYLVPLLYTTTNPRDIVPENSPDIPCIIKTNHDSSGGVIIRDKYDKKYNWKKIQNYLRANMYQNYYWDGRERQYKDIVPRIIVEKLLTSKEGELPADYKVHCFNGKVRMINVDLGRGTNKHHRNWYNRKWEREPYSWSSDLGDGKLTDPSSEEVAKPVLLDKMIELSEKLVGTVPYLRVDWYIFENKLYFGELTFHHNGGNRPIKPEKWDLILGSELNLTHNQ